MSRSVTSHSLVRAAAMVLGAVLGLLAAGAGAAGAEYPERPVTYVIPFGAGGESGIAARLQRPYFEQLTGQQLIIDYKPGGGGALVWDEINRFPADGYTIVGINFPHIVLQPLMGAQYKTKDIAAVYIFHYTPHAIIVREDSPFRTLQDLLEEARKRPGEIAFSGSGRGTSNHLAQLQFDKLADVQTVYKPYKGTGASVAALLQGVTQAAWAYTTVGPEYGKQVRVLAVATETRHPRFANVPTFRELGFDFVGGAYRGIAVPKATPKEVRLRISEIFHKINTNPEFIRKKEALGFATVDVPYAEIPAFIATRRAEYLPIAREAGLVK